MRLALVLGLVIACSPGSAAMTSPGPAATPPEGVITPGVGATAAPVDATAALSDGTPVVVEPTPVLARETWQTAALSDVLNGTEFTIDGLKGNLVVVETMAIWCTTCRVQQREAQAALQQLDRPDVVYISLDVDPNERANELAQYARGQGFEWRFAIAPPAVSRSLAADFGDQILSPPSTPLIILDTEGQLIEQHLGIKSAGDLAALLSEHLP